MIIIVFGRPYKALLNFAHQTVKFLCRRQLKKSDADLESLELASRGEFGSPMTRRVLLDSRLAEDIVASGGSAKSSVVGESPVGFELPSSDEVVCSGSTARAGVIVGL